MSARASRMFILKAAFLAGSLDIIEGFNPTKIAVFNISQLE